MTTRRFTDDLPDPESPSSQDDSQSTTPSLQSILEESNIPDKTETSSLPPPPSPSSARSTRGSMHLPRTLADIITEADTRVFQGNMVDYIPIPTGFDPLDGLMGGGLRKTELTLLGGAQGVGKTVTTLQMARNIAMQPGQFAFYLSFEHTPAHLMHRLLCLESLNPPALKSPKGLTLRDLYKVIVANRAKTAIGKDGGAGSLQNILADNDRTRVALERMQQYANRLIMLKGSPAVTNLRAIKEMTTRLADATKGNVVLFVDYLQKISVQPERPQNEAEKVTIIAEGLKDIALSLDIPVWAIVAADREGLKSKRLHLHHLRGSSALDYESDVAIIMNNKYQILAKDHPGFNPYTAKQFRNWVVFTIEKNRSGRAMQECEFELLAPHFTFNPRGGAVQQELIDGTDHED